MYRISTFGCREAVSCDSEVSFLFSHLSFAELQKFGELFPLGGRQVLLVLEFLLQLHGLVVGEAYLTTFPLVQGPLDERVPQEWLPRNCIDLYRERGQRVSLG